MCGNVSFNDIRYKDNSYNDISSNYESPWQGLRTGKGRLGYVRLA